MKMKLPDIMNAPADLERLRADRDHWRDVARRLAEANDWQVHYGDGWTGCKHCMAKADLRARYIPFLQDGRPTEIAHAPDCPVRLALEGDGA